MCYCACAIIAQPKLRDYPQALILDGARLDVDNIITQLAVTHLLTRFNETIDEKHTFCGCSMADYLEREHYRAAACDVTGGVASLHFDATELQIF